MKKLFIISGSFFLLVLVFLGVYNFAFRHNVANPVADPEEKAEADKKREAALAEAETRSVAFVQIIGEGLAYPAPYENSIFYYSKRDNALKEANLEGKEVRVRLGQIPGEPTRIVWSPTRIQALLLLKNDAGGLWHLADLRNETVIPIKEGVSRLAWTSLGDRILYQATDAATGERSLNIAFPDGSNWSKLADLGRDDHFVSAIPRSSSIAFWPKTDGLRESDLETVTINGTDRKTIIAPRFGADFLWSPDSRRLLVQSTNESGRGLALGVTDDTGAGYRNLFAPTFTFKVTWSKDNETIYYALPGAFSGDAVLPNDYFAKPIYTSDTFWKMNLRTGKKERLVPLEEMTEGYDVSDLFLSPDETDLYFLDRRRSQLFRITL